MTRRDLLRAIGLGTAAGAATRSPAWPVLDALGGAPQAAARASFVADVDLALTAAPGEVQLLPGATTRVWRFTGSVLSGPADALQAIPNSYLGPTIRVRRGQKVRIRFSNRLPEPSIVHWHGLDVPSAMDGHPHRVIDEGAEYVYEFDVANRAGTYWYHPHPHGRTGAQVYRGLAGLFIVSDDEEAALDLPSGEHEISCVLQDRRVDAQNQLVYLESGMNSMMTAMHGFLGERVLVNGREQPTLALATRAYRLRVLNGSNARIYKLAWSDQAPMTVIGGDGGLLEAPIRQRYVTLAPAQRVDLVLDLSGRTVGTTVQLLSAPFPAAEADSMEMGMGSVRNGAPLPLLTINVARQERSSFRLPTRLSSFGASWQPVGSAATRRITLAFQAGQWQLGGRTFEMMEVASDEIVAAGSTQIWDLANAGGMMGMQMAHPIHLHGPQFRVLNRTRGRGAAASSLSEGVIDAGWTDTVLVLPGETVRIQVTFTRHPGLYLYHCHLLEHEDMGMMRNFRVNA